MQAVGVNNRIKFIREYLQLSIPEFANYLNVPENILLSVEETNAEVPLNLLKALFDKADISSNWLITGKGKIFISDYNFYSYSADAGIKTDNLYNLKEEELHGRIRNLENSIQQEANIPLKQIRLLFSNFFDLQKDQVLENPNPKPIAYNLSELSIQDKIFYYKELDKQFKSTRTEFLTHFNNLITLLKQSNQDKNN